MNYEIVNRIVVQEDKVYYCGAANDVRPLNFVHREEAQLTYIFQTRGLRALLAAILRDVYHGRIHLRAGSSITRALRKSIHSLTLEALHRLDEDTVVDCLSIVAEKILVNPDYDPTDELRALLQENKSDSAVVNVDKIIHVKLFGVVELENHLGHIMENPSKQSFPWLLLKYLLLNRGRDVSQEELFETVWAAAEEDNTEGAARVRLRRLREALRPLGLDKETGLVRFHLGNYSLNPDNEIICDTDRFAGLSAVLKECAVSDPAGLQLCQDILELLRGPFLQHTQDAPWLNGYRSYYSNAFRDLAPNILERMSALQDYRLVPLLCNRAIVLAPGEEELHREIISYLVEHKQEFELVRYISQLSRTSDGAKWLDTL